MWTKFYDMSSGGTKKTQWRKIYIELPKDEAVEYFEGRFGIHPYNVTCSCCGVDFDVCEVDEKPKSSSEILIIGEDELFKNDEY